LTAQERKILKIDGAGAENIKKKKNKIEPNEHEKIGRSVEVEKGGVGTAAG